MLIAPCRSLFFRLLTGGRVLPEVRGVMELKHVSFAYPSRSHVQVNFELCRDRLAWRLHAAAAFPVHYALFASVASCNAHQLCLH